MEDLPLGRTAALVPEFSVKDLPLGRTLWWWCWWWTMIFGDRWGPKFSWHGSYSWGKTPEKASTRKTGPIRDRTGRLDERQRMLALDHGGGNILDTYSGGPGLKSRCRQMWLAFFSWFPSIIKAIAELEFHYHDQFYHYSSYSTSSSSSSSSVFCPRAGPSQNKFCAMARHFTTPLHLFKR